MIPTSGGQILRLRGLGLCTRGRTYAYLRTRLDFSALFYVLSLSFVSQLSPLSRQYQRLFIAMPASLCFYPAYIVYFSLECSATQGVLTGSAFEVPIYNDLAHQRYNITVKLGSQPQAFSLLFDTGSTDVWVAKPISSGCTPNYPDGFDMAKSSLSVELDIVFDARYGLTPDLVVLGSYYNGSVSVSPLPTLRDVKFAVGDVPPLLFAQGNWGIFGFWSRL